MKSTRPDFPKREAMLADIKLGEQSYYKNMPESIRDAIELREGGWLEYRNENFELANEGLQHSIALIMDTFQPGPISTKKPSDDYLVELFVSLARFANFNTAQGEFEHGAIAAQDALSIKNLPYSGVITTDYYPRHTVSVFPDQNRIKFAGRLSACLAASPIVYLAERDACSHMRLARQLAREARFIAPFSEDPDRVLFPSADLSDAERLAARAKHIGEARAAMFIARAPTLGLRQTLARKLCSK